MSSASGAASARRFCPAGFRNETIGSSCSNAYVAGRRRSPEVYPREPDDAWIWDEDEPESQNGWTDLRFLDDMWVAQGAGAAAHKSTPTFRSTRSLRVRLAVPDHLFCIS